MKRINLNTVLAALGGLAVVAPDVASIAAFLASFNIPRLGLIVRLLGFLAGLLASLPRIITALRPTLAALNLATPHECLPPAGSTSDPGVLGNPETPSSKQALLRDVAIQDSFRSKGASK